MDRRGARFRIKNHGFCIENDGFCIENDELCISNVEFAFKTMEFVLTGRGRGRDGYEDRARAREKTARNPTTM